MKIPVLEMNIQIKYCTKIASKINYVHTLNTHEGKTFREIDMGTKLENFGNIVMAA